MYHPPPGSHPRNVTRLHYLPVNRGVQHASGTEKREKIPPMFLQLSHQHATWTPCSTHRATSWLQLRHISTLPDTCLVAQWKGKCLVVWTIFDKKKSFFAEKSNREFVVRCFGVRNKFLRCGTQNQQFYFWFSSCKSVFFCLLFS